MKTVRMDIQEAELDEIIEFIQFYQLVPTPGRLNGTPQDRLTIDTEVASILCTRLLIRLLTGRIIRKPKYRFTVPREQALALVRAWLQACGTQHSMGWPMAKYFIGTLHQKLA